ncbi:hypothetical protein, partial [Veillonella montpellierensis]|uniref:MuF-C-terminal domain-containing protein n=1 Tax=Veillonella montpellierensis TaxID=187328 RepID=UPI0023F918B4
MAQTYHTILLEAQAEFREKYNRQYQNVKQAEKNGVSIPYVSMDGIGSNVITPEAERMRVIAYNRQLEKESVHNDPEATLMIDQTYDEMEQASKSIRDIEGLEGAVDKIAKGDVAMCMNFSKDGYQVFQDVYNTLRQSPNREVAKQAKEGALLFASHADVMANIMQKAGKWDFTAKDYMDRYISIQMGGKNNIGSFNQSTALEANQKLDLDAQQWEQNLSTIHDYKSNKPIRVMSTPMVLRNIGAGNHDIVIKQSKIATILKEHKDIKKDTLKQLPYALANPVAIFPSNTVSGSIVVMAEIKADNGLNIIIPMQLNKVKRNGLYVYNLINSVYTKDTVGKDWYHVRLTSDKYGKPLYINEKKATKWYLDEGFRLPQAKYQINDFFTDRIPNEEDLRKLKEENPSYYQSQQSGVTKQQVIAAKEKLKADTEAWGTLIDSFKANKVTGNRHRVMSMPLVYQMIGMSNKDIYIENNIILNCNMKLNSIQIYNS